MAWNPAIWSILFWIFMALIIFGGVGVLIWFYVQFDKKIWTLERRANKTPKLRILKARGVNNGENWQVFDGGINWKNWPKIPAPKKEYLYNLGGKDWRLCKRIDKCLFIDLILEEETEAILKHAPIPNFRQWEMQEIKTDHERMVARSEAKWILGITLLILCIVALIIFFVLYSEHMMTIIGNMKSATDQYLALGKCAQEFNATMAGVPP